jgi:peptidoglycan/xylan/chitin deacetylase (PgdA/CDA1 family)
MVALTYDDGPAKGSSRQFLDMAMCWPGQVTFFLIGQNIQRSPETVYREYDSGYSVQSHSWAHAFSEIMPEELAAWEREFDRTLTGMIGKAPVMMRPPGGQWLAYLLSGSKLPQILWSINSDDADTEPDRLFGCFMRSLSARDGDIVLFHDARSVSRDLAEMCMARFEERNTLLVTVDDLCALRGISLEAGLVLKDCHSDAEE